mmetsp:Transcript_31115/g.67100  ORF Transcript_31115/g.67100 Transcript_31115/m.67100 type:complete len:229 (+) Transcript_31115:165-851(+)
MCLTSLLDRHGFDHIRCFCHGHPRPFVAILGRESKSRCQTIGNTSCNTTQAREGGAKYSSSLAITAITDLPLLFLRLFRLDFHAGHRLGYVWSSGFLSLWELNPLKLGIRKLGMNNCRADRCSSSRLFSDNETTNTLHMCVGLLIRKLGMNNCRPDRCRISRFSADNKTTNISYRHGMWMRANVFIRKLGMDNGRADGCSSSMLSANNKTMNICHGCHGMRMCDLSDL